MTKKLAAVCALIAGSAWAQTPNPYRPMDAPGYTLGAGTVFDASKSVFIFPNAGTLPALPCKPNTVLLTVGELKVCTDAFTWGTLSGAGGSTPAGTAGQVQINNGESLGALTLNGVPTLTAGVMSQAAPSDLFGTMGFTPLNPTLTTPQVMAGALTLASTTTTGPNTISTGYAAPLFFRAAINTGATQGYATDGTNHFIIGTGSISEKNQAWQTVWSNTHPFLGLPNGEAHIGDGEWYNGNLYVPINPTYGTCPTSYSPLVIAEFVGSTGALDTFSTVTEPPDVSALAVVPSQHAIYIASFCDGSQLWKYDLNTFAFLGTLPLTPNLPSMQGISFNSTTNQFAISSNDATGTIGYIYFADLAGHVTGPIYTSPFSGEQEGIDYTTANGAIAFVLGGNFQTVYFISPGLATDGIDADGDGRSINMPLATPGTTGFYNYTNALMGSAKFGIAPGSVFALACPAGLAQPFPGVECAQMNFNASGQLLIPGGIGISYQSPKIPSIPAVSGYANDGTSKYIMATNTITQYTESYQPTFVNNNAFAGLPSGINHIFDGEVYNGNLYVPVENYLSGCGGSTQENIAIYTTNATGIPLASVHDISTSGIPDIHALAVVAATNTIYTVSFCGTGTQMYMFDLNTFAYKGAVTFSTPLPGLLSLSYNATANEFVAQKFSSGDLWVITPSGVVTKLFSTGIAGQSAGVDWTQPNVEYLMTSQFQYALTNGPPAGQERALGLSSNSIMTTGDFMTNDGYGLTDSALKPTGAGVAVPTGPNTTSAHTPVEFADTSGTLGPASPIAVGCNPWAARCSNLTANGFNNLTGFGDSATFLGTTTATLSQAGVEPPVVNAATHSPTATFGNASATMVVSDATGIAVGDQIYGAGIATGATVTGVAGTTITMAPVTTAPGSGVTVVVGLAGVRGTATYATTLQNSKYQTWAKLPHVGDFANARTWLGLSGITVNLQSVSDTPAANFAMFRASSSASDANWKCVTGNGTTTTVVDSGVPIFTTGHRFEIDTTAAGATFFIDGVQVASITTTLPTGWLTTEEFITPLEAVAKNLRIGWVLTQANFQ